MQKKKKKKSLSLPRTFKIKAQTVVDGLLLLRHWGKKTEVKSYPQLYKLWGEKKGFI